MIKLLILFTIINTAFAQLNYGAVTPGDLKFAKCYEPLEENLSKNQIHRLLRAKGHNLSKLMNDSRVGATEFTDLYNAVQLMPSWIKSSKKSYEAKIQYKIDTTLDGVAAFDKNTLMINPKQWNNYYSDMRTAIIFHELSHALGFNQYEIDDSKVWQQIEKGWKPRKYRRNGSIYEGTPLASEGYVSQYSRTNPAEDFAESVSSYRVKPQVLKELSPKKYQFIKDTVFLGQEFITDDNCKKNISDLFNVAEFKKYLVTKLNSRAVYYKYSYESIARSRGVRRHPKAIEKLLLQRTLIVLADRIGLRGKSTKEDFILKNKIRVFLLNSKDLSFIKNHVANGYLDKLLRNTALLLK
jgi:hypothetical protein